MTPLLAPPFVRPRAGLGDLPDRLRSRDCTIAYMGASVAMQKEGYRPRLHELICRRTGRAHAHVPAALGGTGTITGAFLADEWVLRRRPDLAFVEYATFDAGGTTPFEHVAPALEGIVGKLRDAGCEPCFLYLQRGDLDLGASDVVAAYEAVADRHGVPSIDAGGSIRAAIAAGEVEEGALLRDPVHTTPVGSELTAETIYRGLAAIPAGPAPPRVPLQDARFREARLIAPVREHVHGPCGEGSFRLVYPYLELEAGAELRVTLDGELAGLFVVLGPHSGYLEVTAAGVTTDYLLWDEDCDYERLGALVLAPFVPRGEEISIRVSDRAVDMTAAKRPVDPDETARKRLKLAALMVLP
jgi:hypothetical protein